MKQWFKEYKGLIIPLLVAFIAIFGYYSYWKTIGNKILTTIETTKNRDFNYEQVAIKGFPYRHQITLSNFKNNIFGGQLSGDKLIISASPFNPQLWVLNSVQSPIFIDRNGNSFKITPHELQTSLRINFKESLPKIARFSLVAKQIDIDDGNYKSSLMDANIHLIGDGDKNAYAFSISMHNLGRLKYFATKNFEPEVLRGIINNAKTLETDFENWRKNDGSFEIKYGKLNFQKIGPLEYGTFDKLNGKLTLNQTNGFDGTLNGDANLTIFSDKKLSFENFNMAIKDSKLDIEQTLATAITSQIPY